MEGLVLYDLFEIASSSSSIFSRVIFLSTCSSPCLVCLKQKLKRLKHALKKWNKRTFGNVHGNVSMPIDEVYRIQLLIDLVGLSGPTYSCQNIDPT
jgi:hypothetical protein